MLSHRIVANPSALRRVVFFFNVFAMDAKKGNKIVIRDSK